MEFPNVTEIIELLHEVEPTGTKADRFARGGSKMNGATWVKALDYILTACYLFAFGSFAFWTIKTIVEWLPLISR